VSTADWESLEARITGDWDRTDSTLEFAEPSEEYTAIDGSVMFVPYSRVHLKKCPTCGEMYINATYLKEHTARDHAAPTKDPAPVSRPTTRREQAPVSAPHPAYVRPASAPAPVDAANVRPLRPDPGEAEVPMRPEPDSTPPARVACVPRRTGRPRSKPRQGKLRTGRKQSC
jgi:hypothetical protein